MLSILPPSDSLALLLRLGNLLAAPGSFGPSPRRFQGLL